jgi:hypothetical protein
MFLLEHVKIPAIFLKHMTDTRMVIITQLKAVTGEALRPLDARSPPSGASATT